MPRQTARNYMVQQSMPRQTTPNYITIRVNGNNLQSQKTKTAASRYRLKQELLFLYIKKQKTVQDAPKIVQDVPKMRRILAKQLS
jgi:hypothetical protein